MTMRHREWLYRLIVLAVTALVFAYYEGKAAEPDYYVALAKAIGVWVYAELFHRGLMHRNHEEHHHH